MNTSPYSNQNLPFTCTIPDSLLSSVTEQVFKPAHLEESEMETIDDDDSLVGSDGNDELYGSPEEDDKIKIFGLAGDDTIRGLGGDDYLFGGAGNDILDGGDGDDTFVQGSGNQFVDGTGTDSLIGGAGNDTADYRTLGQAITLKADGVVEKGSAGTDQIVNPGDVETIIGALGKDNAIDGTFTLPFPVPFPIATFFDINLSQNHLRVNNIPFQTEPFNFTVKNFVNVIGTLNNDIIVGDRESNTFFGSDGADSIDGGAGADILDGGDGADSLTGGAGNDNLTGGAGADVFVYNAPNEAPDLITDFTEGAGNDVLAILQNGFSDAPGSFTEINTVAAVTDANTSIYLDADATIRGVATSNVRFAFTNDLSTFLYDADGNWTSGVVTLATVTGVTAPVLDNFTTLV
jgi:Ca2+-binding RTX toxin-like protein